MKGLSLRLNSRLTLPTMPGEERQLVSSVSVGAGDYQTFMAQLCATQIRDWLSAGQQGRALLWRNGISRNMKGLSLRLNSRLTLPTMPGEERQLVSSGRTRGCALPLTRRTYRR
jgi:hypothetical protein